MLRASPWWRAPVLLLRTPGVFLACLLAAAVLATTASSGVLFLASTGTASLHNEAGLECPEDAQPAITNEVGANRYPTSEQRPAAWPAGDRAVRSTMAATGLPPADLVATSPVQVEGNRAAGALLFARSGALSHVDVVASAGGSGVWIPQSFASAHGARPGGSLSVGTGRARVAGVYRDLAPSAFVPLFKLPRYWCSWHDAIVPGLFNRPPPLFLTDLATLRSTAQRIDATWYAPTAVTRETVPQARAELTAVDEAVAALPAPMRANYHVTSDLPYLLAKADRVRTGLAGPVLPIELAGTLVAALLVAAAGTFWGLRRQRELALLRSRGVGRVALGVKATLETGPAIALGTLGGWLLAIALVRELGPSNRLEPGAPSTALALSALVGAGALLAVGLTGARTVDADRRRVRAAWSRRVPWELTLLAASALAYRVVRRDGAVHIVKATVQVNPMVLAFPLLALTGAVLLLGRTGGRTLKRSGRRARYLPPSGYLALRRLSSSPAVAIGVLVGVALPIGVLVYSSALSGSTAADVRAKYETNVGADYAFGTLAAPGSTPDVAGHATIVSMIQVDPRIDDGTGVRVMGIDPSSFASFAFNGAQLRDVTRDLVPGSGPAAALLVNAPPGTRVTHLRIRTVDVPVHVVATRASFPGLRDPFAPLLVVNRAALPRLDPLTDRVEELWTSKAAVTPALAALTSHGVESNYEITPKTFLDNTGLRPVTWIFGYLRALAYLTGLVAFAGLTFALTAQTRRRALSYHLARRMGLSRTGHRRSIAIELSVLLTASWVAGAGLAMGAVALVYRLTDAYPNLPPPPVLPMPGSALLSTACAALTAGALGTWLLQRELDRIQPSNLLRA